MSEAKPFSLSAATKKEREEREKRELREKRERQLAEMREGAETLQLRLQSMRSARKRCDALLNHSGGFYDEVNKLAKGKALLEVTPLALERANEIIRDAKAIVKGDVYLDRIKEFVPAGNNPVYPDVLVNIRAVRDTLGRFKDEASSRLDNLSEKLRRASTAVGALEYFLDDDAEGDENDKNFPSRDVVEYYTDGTVSNSCFFQGQSYKLHFDFGALDRQTTQEYILLNEEDEPAGTDASADQEGSDDNAETPTLRGEIGEAPDEEGDSEA